MIRAQRRLEIGDGEPNLGPHRLADPVALQREHFVGPAGQILHRREKFFGVIGDSQEPLPQVAFGDLGIAAPAATRFDLFVRQDGLAAGDTS